MDHVNAAVRGAVGCIRLERPEALNALNVPMFEAIDRALDAWRDDPSVAAVLMRGSGKAFSAGGDIRAVRDAVLRADVAHNEALYRCEYGVNGVIAAYPKPYVALIDGYCFGGGMGLAVHGAHRVVSERAQLAMPETAIGFFPDVGLTYVFARLPGALGTYLGLTGYRMDAADAIACGVADAYVPAAAHDALERAILDDPAALEATLRAFAQPPGEAKLAEHRAAIDRCFGASSVAEIAAALERERTAWADATLATLRRMSPWALTVSLELFRRGAAMSLSECLEMELRVGRPMAQHPDFREGVRAIVIDKDRTPSWTPATIEEIDVADVRRIIADAMSA